MLILGAIGFAPLAALWLARAGYRRDAVCALRHRRLVPAMLSSWLTHRYADTPQAAHSI